MGHLLKMPLHMLFCGLHVALGCRILCSHCFWHRVQEGPRQGVVWSTRGMCER